MSDGFHHIIHRKKDFVFFPRGLSIFIKIRGQKIIKHLIRKTSRPVFSFTTKVIAHYQSQEKSLCHIYAIEDVECEQGTSLTFGKGGRGGFFRWSVVGG